MDKFKQIEGAEVRTVDESGILFQHPDSGKYYQLNISHEAIESGLVALAGLNG